MFFDLLYGGGAALLVTAALVLALLTYLSIRYSREFQRLFERAPTLLAPELSRPEDDRPISFKTAEGRTLVGSYFLRRTANRRGVIIFCPEFTGNRWLFQRYVDYLRDDGFDIFAFDFSNHGESERVESLPLQQWVTHHDVSDLSAAIDYLASRDDAPSHGYGLFGVSKGGTTGIVVAAEDPRIRAVVTDGAFPTHSLVTRYVQRWVHMIGVLGYVAHFLPDGLHRLITRIEIRRISRRNGCHYPHVETSFRQLTAKPFFLIHGKRDSYIHVEVVQDIFRPGRQPTDLWIVSGAKHNLCIEVAEEEYRQRVSEFFRRHLGDSKA